MDTELYSRGEGAVIGLAKAGVYILPGMLIGGIVGAVGAHYAGKEICDYLEVSKELFSLTKKVASVGIGGIVGSLTGGTAAYLAGVKLEEMAEKK